MMTMMMMMTKIKKKKMVVMMMMMMMVVVVVVIRVIGACLLYQLWNTTTITHLFILRTRRARSYNVVRKTRTKGKW